MQASAVSQVHSTNRPATRGVLIVEPQEMVRTTLGMLLQHKGVASYTAASAVEAKRIYQNHAAEIGVILMDVHPADTDGRQTLQQLRDINPAARCYFMTGNPTPELTEGNSLGVVAKPFLFRVLDQIVQWCSTETK